MSFYIWQYVEGRLNAAHTDKDKILVLKTIANIGSIKTLPMLQGLLVSTESTTVRVHAIWAFKNLGFQNKLKVKIWWWVSHSRLLDSKRKWKDGNLLLSLILGTNYCGFHAYINSHNRFPCEPSSNSFQLWLETIFSMLCSLSLSFCYYFDTVHHLGQFFLHLDVKWYNNYSHVILCLGVVIFHLVVTGESCHCHNTSQSCVTR